MQVVVPAVVRAELEKAMQAAGAVTGRGLPPALRAAAPPHGGGFNTEWSPAPRGL
jgi:hypothetical protein